MSGYFGLEFGKTMVIFEISTLEFIKKEFLTILVNFDVGSAFYKSSGFAFSERPGLGPGSFYMPLKCMSLYVFKN